MIKKFMTTLLAILLLSACSTPQPEVSTPTADAVATQVAQLLTTMPTATATLAEGVATPTVAPSDTPQTETATSTPLAETTTTATATTATPTALAATETVAPTATLASQDPKLTLGEPSWTDTLDTSKSFYLYENDNTRVAHADSALLLTGVNANGWIGWSLTYNNQPQNFYLEGVFIPQSCSGADFYGVVFRAPNANAGYFYGVTCDGRYSLHARNFEDGSGKTLIDLTENAAIQKGANQTNRLGVMVKGDKIGVYANGILLQEVTDSTFPNQGYLGAFVSANDTPGFTVKLDEISLWTLP